MGNFKHIVELTGLVVEATGVLVIVLGMAFALARFLWLVVRSDRGAYRRLREDLGRGILLGLEFLVAGDIIRTVAVDPNLENVLVLGIIVLVRTFLSMSLQVELEGRLPWRNADEAKQPSA